MRLQKPGKSPAQEDPRQGAFLSLTRLTLRRVGKYLLSVGVAALVAVSGSNAMAGESGEAEALIRQGVELRQQKKDERALPFFEKAYQISRTPRTAGQLGLVQMAVGYYVEAERHLAEALQSPDHPWVAKNLATLKSQLESLKPRIGELHVIGEPAGAEVWVNGKAVGKLPLPAPIRLDKGRADVQVRAPGYVTGSDTVTIAGGKREDRSFRLTREATPAPAPPPPVVATAPPPPASSPPPPAAKPPATMPAPTATATPAPTSVAATSSTSMSPSSDGPPTVTATAQPEQPGGSSALRPWAWGTAAGAAAGLVFGVVEAITAGNKRDAFNNHTGPDPNTPGGTIKDCNTDVLTAACRPLKEDFEQAKTMALVGFAVGGALAVGSAVLFWLSTTESAGGSQSAFACVPDPVTRGATCSLRF
jgi:hypothetical protein